MKHPISIAIVALPVALLAAGCGGGDQAGDTERTGDMTRQRIGQAQSNLSPAVSAKLDSGNTAYRAGDYERALTHYRSAADLEEEAAAPWFGVYMAYSAMGREDSARAALERAGSLSESGGAFHGAGDSAGGMPNPHDTAGGMPNPHEGMDMSGDEGGSRE